MATLSETNARARRRPTVLVKAIACVVLVISPACMTPDLRVAEPGPVMPDKFPQEFPGATDAGSSAQVSVADFFRDPVLTELIEHALGHNQELKILAEEIQIANSEVLARKGAYLPFVELRAGSSLKKTPKYTPDGAVEEQLNAVEGKVRKRPQFTPDGQLEPAYIEGSNKHFPNPLPSFMVAAEFSWEVDIWNRLHNARDAATLHYLATNEGRKYIVTRLVAEIAESYYALLALDERLAVIDQTIALQKHSLEVAQAKKAAARGTELAVQRFQAEVKKNESERLIVKQEIVKAENRVNLLLGRFPQKIERGHVNFMDLNLDSLSVGVSPELLQNRPDIRRAEFEVKSTGFDVKAAKAAFYPTLTLTGGIGYEAYNTRFLLQSPESLAANITGGLVGPLFNRTEIESQFRMANARQLSSIYEYQRTVLNAFVEVANRVSMVQNFRQSIELKRQQLKSLEESVASASQLFQNARAEYSEVLFAQRDLLEAKLVLIDIKREQLSAIVNAYQALGGGSVISGAVASQSPQPESQMGEMKPDSDA
ncbi:MAG TPA: TolC family protein [Phycisphaerae bacterium]|nr:TolC family protein [Phycisphaerae bacterium]HRW52191.1 TolC family protein [Phycisphaerae bacterium]